MITTKNNSLQTKKNIILNIIFFFCLVVSPIFADESVWDDIESEAATDAIVDSHKQDAIPFDPNDADVELGQIEQITLGDAPASRIIVLMINFIITFLGLAFLILIIYAGFLWMTARGNEEQITKSKKILVRAIIGLTIVLLSYSLAYLVYYIIGANATGVEANMGVKIF